MWSYPVHAPPCRELFVDVALTHTHVVTVASHGGVLLFRLPDGVVPTWIGTRTSKGGSAVTGCGPWVVLHRRPPPIVTGTRVARLFLGLAWHGIVLESPARADDGDGGGRGGLVQYDGSIQHAHGTVVSRRTRSIP